MTPKLDKSFIHTLKTEAEAWLRDGIVSGEQKARILSRYERIAAAEETAAPGKLIATVTVLGSILVGIGVLLFVASNWSRIPNAGRLAIIFSSMLASYGGGFALWHERGNYPRAGEALILLGALIFGGGIFLIAQMYHITVHYPNGPLLWGLAVLPLAYVLGLKTLLALSIIDLLIWLGMESTFAVSIMTGSTIALISLFLLAGIVLWVTGLTHRSIKPLSHLSGPYIAIGLFLTFAAGYILTFFGARWQFGAPAFTNYYFSFAILFIVAMAIFMIRGDKDRIWIAETAFLTALFLIILLFSLTSSSPDPYAAPYAYDYRGFGKTRLAFNLLYALQIVGVIVLGYFRRNRIYINLGLAFFVLDVIARYFDFFWRLLPRSLFFIGGGILLLTGGVLLEKKRRKVLASFHMEAD